MLPLPFSIMTAPPTPSSPTPDLLAHVRALIERLALQPHPEGGYFRETHRSPRSRFHPPEGDDWPWPIALK